MIWRARGNHDRDRGHVHGLGLLSVVLRVVNVLEELSLGHGIGAVGAVADVDCLHLRVRGGLRRVPLGFHSGNEGLELLIRWHGKLELGEEALEEWSRYGTRHLKLGESFHELFHIDCYCRKTEGGRRAGFSCYTTRKQGNVAAQADRFGSVHVALPHWPNQSPPLVLWKRDSRL